MSFSDFIADLTGPQVRALAAQSGIQEWGVDSTDSLRRQLLDNTTATLLWEKVYRGKEARISG